MGATPKLPIPLSLINDRYLLFSVDAVSYLRREYHICGVLIGSIPQIPQQNVFLGLPLELMPEEARLLVDKGIGYVVDDAKAHDEAIGKVEEDRRELYLAALTKQGREASHARTGRKEQQRDRVLRTVKKSSLSSETTIVGAVDTAASSENLVSQKAQSTATDEDLFTTADDPKSISVKPLHAATIGVTPATSDLLLSTPSRTLTPSPIRVPTSYPLFLHLHGKGYFISPGLRFGCNYTVYPGDPLRFHSHFLAVGVDWDEEIDLMKIVAGGRLGTGVKKGYLMGGPAPESDGNRAVRTFSVEWAGL